MRPKKLLAYFTKNLATAVGIVMIWRGVWYLMDAFDNLVFGGHTAWTALGSVAVGVLILYLPDRDLKEIEKL